MDPTKDVADAAEAARKGEDLASALIGSLDINQYAPNMQELVQALLGGDFEVDHATRRILPRKR